MQIEMMLCLALASPQEPTVVFRAAPMDAEEAARATELAAEFLDSDEVEFSHPYVQVALGLAAMDFGSSSETDITAFATWRRIRVPVMENGAFRYSVLVTTRRDGSMSADGTVGGGGAKLALRVYERFPPSRGYSITSVQTQFGWYLQIYDGEGELHWMTPVCVEDLPEWLPTTDKRYMTPSAFKENLAELRDWYRATCVRIMPSE